jgi:hypothetical protein
VKTLRIQVASLILLSSIIPIYRIMVWSNWAKESEGLLCQEIMRGDLCCSYWAGNLSSTGWTNKTNRPSHRRRRKADVWLLEPYRLSVGLWRELQHLVAALLRTLQQLEISTPSTIF